MKRFFIFLLVLLFCPVLFAQNSAPVVKQEGLKVYLDITDIAFKIAQGDIFTITRWGEEIKNPKTGKVLGRDIVARVKGKVDIVEPAYAIGFLEKSFEVKGFDAVFDKKQTVLEPKTKEESSSSFKAFWQSELVDGKIRAAASGDLNGDGFNELILAFEDNTIKIYTIKEDKLKEEYSYSLNPLRRIISLDSADIQGQGRAQLFASVLDNSSQRFNTLVFEEQDNSLQQNGTFNGIVKGIAPFNTERRLYLQEVNILSGKTKFTTPALLSYKDSSFTKGSKVPYTGFNDIFGFNFGPFKDNKENLIYTAFNSRLRVQYEKKNRFVESPSDIDFGTASNRVKFNKETLKFYSSLGLYYSADQEILIAGIENQTKYGILSEAFGSYESAILYVLKWNKGVFEKYISAEIPGVVNDIIQAPFGPYEDILIVPFSNRAQQSGVMLFKIK